MQKYLPTNDLLFRKLLTSEDSLYILKAFVKDLLGIEFQSLMPKETYHIDSYKKKFNEIDHVQTEILRTEVDILAIGEDGSHATIECQIQPHSYLHERSLFYLAEAFRSPFGSSDKKEAGKKNNFSSLRPAYGINIVDFHLFDRKDNALHLFRLLNEETHQPFFNEENKELLILCFLSLKNQTIEKQKAAYHWQYFLKTGEVEPEAPDYIKEAKRKIDFLTLESEEKEMIMNIEKSKAISDAVFVSAMEKGRKEGEEKTKQALAVEFLKIGVSIEQVAKATKLSTEEVDKLWREQN
ncbi:Rpn family recombination-promoting nuclease/putative transposase [Enterococcus sp. AZ007]|uniref:Rpn family recombination-promoting nuclease/putative transposase n=1 Tax=Enterococcus sp. AZ007 TaxID=2774839 RepID=UPI003F2843AF